MQISTKNFDLEGDRMNQLEQKNESNRLGCSLNYVWSIREQAVYEDGGHKVVEGLIRL